MVPLAGMNGMTWYVWEMKHVKYSNHVKPKKCLQQLQNASKYCKIKIGKGRLEENIYGQNLLTRPILLYKNQGAKEKLKIAVEDPTRLFYKNLLKISDLKVSHKSFRTSTSDTGDLQNFPWIDFCESREDTNKIFSRSSFPQRSLESTRSGSKYSKSSNQDQKENLTRLSYNYKDQYSFSRTSSEDSARGSINTSITGIFKTFMQRTSIRFHEDHHNILPQGPLQDRCHETFINWLSEHRATTNTDETRTKCWDSRVRYQNDQNEHRSAMRSWNTKSRI